MQINLSDETVRDVEALLAKLGEQGSVSAYIDRTVQRAVFFETVREIKRQNANCDAAEIDSLIKEAVTAVRADTHRAFPHANGA